MNRSYYVKKLDIKTKKKNTHTIDEENVSFKEVKEDKQRKHFRNYDNALRSKDLNKLLSYEED